MKKGLRGFLPAFLAVIMAVSMMPAVASAKEADQSEEGTNQPAVVVTDTTERGEANAAARISQLLQEQTETGQNKADLPALYSPEDAVTLIVQLEGAPVSNQTFSALSSLMRRNEHNSVKKKIQKLIENDASEAGDSDLQLFEYDEDGQAEEAPVFDVLYDYYHVMNGFAVTVEYRFLEEIRTIAGVKAAFVEQIYSVPDTEATEGDLTYANDGSNAMVGAKETALTGKGQVIAIIDSGLDVNHEAFSGKISDPAMDEAYILSKLPALTNKDRDVPISEVYVSEKIPYVYDYADKDTNVVPSGYTDLSHGTHVAGIAAANGGTTIRGIAPDAQIMMLKTFDDLMGQGRDSNIIAAVEDAYLLDVDSINMSLGADAGFSTDSNDLYQEIYDNVEKAGITLNIAAGNSYSSAYGSVDGTNLPNVKNPDNSILAAPGSYNAAFTVASAESVTMANYFLAPDKTTQIKYREGTLTSGEKKLFTSLEDGDYAYVDCGFGSEEEIQAALKEAGLDDLSGKFALISRGGTDASGQPITFEAKVDQTAYAKGLGAIVYDNVEAETLVNMGGITQTELYSIFISKADGELLKAQETKLLTAGSDLVKEEPVSMSDFSSWGATPDLKLKPEITAPGGTIYSAVPGEGAYQTMSGTSMATPAVAGLSALVREYVESDAKFASFSQDEKNHLITALLMNTATPIRRGADSWYSPRKQGAGMANIMHVTNAKAYLTVEGAADAKPKAELGDGTGEFRFAFTIHNLTDEALTYTADACALSELIENAHFQQKSTDYAGKGVSITFDGADAQNRIEVAAGGTKEITVTIKAEAAFAEAVKAAVNGTFLEGYVMLSADENSGSDLSLPYLAFYGDWGAAKMIEANNTTKDAEYFMQQSYVYSAGNSYYYLGQNVFDPSLGTNPDRFAISSDSLAQIFSGMATVTGLLRSADRLSYVITDQQGRVVKENVYDHVKKSYYFASAGRSTYAEAFLDPAPTFYGTGDDGAEVANGEYTMTITASVAGKEAATDSWSYNFWYDTQDPVVKGSRIIGQEGNQSLEITVQDNHYLSAVQLVSNNGAAVQTLTFENPDIREDGVSTYTILVDYEDLQSKLEQIDGARTDIVYLDAFDYAVNFSEAELVVMDTYPDSLTLDQTEATLTKGQDLTLVPAFSPAEITKNGITWTSSDETVATVSADGTVTAVAEGTAVIRAQSEVDAVFATCNITVNDVTEEQGIIINKDAVKVNMNDTVQLNAVLANSLEGQRVSWSCDDEAYAKVDQNGLVSGISTGTTTVHASVSKDGKTWSADCVVQVRPENYDDFEIDENGVLKSYSGWRSYVEIPEGVTRIDDYVFYMTPVVGVNIPSTCKEIGNYVFEDCQRMQSITFSEGSQLEKIGTGVFTRCYQLSSCVLPDSVKELGESMFYSCLALAEFRVPEKVTEIPAFCFYYTSALKKITLPEGLRVIGAHGFDSCGVEEMELPQSLEEIGELAFAASSYSKLVTYPNLKKIGRMAFGEAKLSEVTLSEGLEEIGLAAFKGNRFTTFTIPDSVTTVGASVLESCTSLKTATIGKNVTALETPFTYDHSLEAVFVHPDNRFLSDVDGILFSKDQKTLITIPYRNADLVATHRYTVPKSVVTIADNAGMNLTELEQLQFEEGSNLEEIGAQGFAYTNLTSLSLPDKAKTLGKNAFGFCLDMTQIHLNHAESLGAYCFQYTPCASPDYGDSLRSIGEYAFAWASAMKNVELPDSVETIANDAYLNISTLESIHTGKSLKEIGIRVFTGAPSVRTITSSEGAEGFVAENNVLYSKDKTRLVLYAPQNSLSAYRAPETLLTIDPFAFRSASLLNRVILPEGLTDIGYSAFNGASGITQLNVPSTVQHIGTYAFLNVPVSELYLTGALHELEEHTFGFTSLEHLVIDGVDDLDIPWQMLMGSNLKSIYLGAGVKRVSGTLSSSTPKIVVLGDDLEEVSERAFTDFTNVTFYAKAGSKAYGFAEAQRDAIVDGGGKAAVKNYTPLSAKLRIMDANTSETATLQVKGNGGIGTKTYRFVTVDADGQETEVSAYSNKNSCKIKVPEDGVTVRAYVRDESWYSVSDELTVSRGDRMEDGDYVAGAAFYDAADKTTKILTAEFPQNAVELNKQDDRYRITLAFTDAVTGVTVGETEAERTEDGRYVLEVSDPGADIALTVNNGQQVEAILKIDLTSLTLPADKTLLEEAIARADKLVRDHYTSTSYRAVYNARKSAVSVEENLLATQEAVDSALDGLQNALNGLVVKFEAGRSYTTKVKLTNNNTGTGNSMVNQMLNPNAVITYEADGTWSGQISFRKGSIMGIDVNGQNVDEIRYYLNDEQLEAEIIKDNAVRGERTFMIRFNDLSDIVHTVFTYTISGSQRSNEAWMIFPEPTDLTVVTQADTSALEALMDQAAALSSGDYSELSWAELETAMAEAQAVLDDLTADESAVEEAMKAVQNAMDGLVAATHRPRIISVGDSSEIFEEYRQIRIVCDTEGATIYYTTDGTEPTTESEVYTTPITLRSSAVVKAVAVKEGLGFSDVAASRFLKASEIETRSVTEIVDNFGYEVTISFLVYEGEIIDIRAEIAEGTDPVSVGYMNSAVNGMKGALIGKTLKEDLEEDQIDTISSATYSSRTFRRAAKELSADYRQVTGVSFLEESVLLTTGSTKQLSAEVQPDYAVNRQVSFTSSDETVATVSPEGLVTAVAAGEAIITVLTSDGGFSGECRITVKDGVVVENSYTTPIRIATDAEGGGSSMVNNLLDPAAIVTQEEDGSWSVLLSFREGQIFGITLNGQDVDAVKYEAGGEQVEAEIVSDNTDRGVRTFKLAVASLADIAGLNFTYNANGTQQSNDAWLVFTDPEALAPYIQAETAELEGAIAQADGLLASDYTEESYRAVEEALAKAKAAKADPTADAQDVAKAFKALQEAIAALVQKETSKPLNGLYFQEETVSLTEGETRQLAVIFTPADATDKTVTWTSSDETIADVSRNGLVTAIKAGTVQITVTAQDGGYQASCLLTVSAKPGTPTPQPGKQTIKIGSKVTVGKLVYKVTGKKAVRVIAPKSKKLTSVTIPATVKISGKKYKVTSIAKNAFKGMSKLKKVVIGKNVKTIGAKAFYGDKKLKTITVKTTLLTKKTVGKAAFKNTAKKAVVKVPAKKLKAYKKFLKTKGLSKQAKVKK